MSRYVKAAYQLEDGCLILPDLDQLSVGL